MKLALFVVAVALSGCRHHDAFAASGKARETYTAEAKLLRLSGDLKESVTIDGVPLTTSRHVPVLVELAPGRTFEIDQNTAYSAMFHRKCEVGDKGLVGVEVRHGKIISVSTFYCRDDETSELQHDIDMQASSGTVIFPEGSHVLSRTLELPAGLKLVSGSKSKIIWIGGTSACAIHIAEPSAGLVVRDFDFSEQTQEVAAYLCVDDHWSK